MKRITFTIETLLGRLREVHGYQVVPGIAVHGVAVSWQVTHSVSGWLLQSGREVFPTRADAVTYARKLVRAFPSVDWTVEVGELDEAVTEAIKERFEVLPKGGRYAAIQQILRSLEKATKPKKEPGWRTRAHKRLT